MIQCAIKSFEFNATPQDYVEKGLYMTLTIKKLNKVYGNDFTALHEIDLEVNEGEIFGLLGPNGAGKSTLINILCGIVRKSSGEVSVCGFQVPEQHIDVKKIIGVVPQELCADGFFSIQQVLEYQSGYYGIKNNLEYIEYLLKSLSLYDKKDEIARHLSGGMKRRLMVAKAMVHKPKILILDEPTAGVDIHLTVSLWELVKTLNKQGTTIILTTHNLKEAEEICDRICIINKGNILALDKTENLLKRLGDTKLMCLFFKDMPTNLEAIDDFKYSLNKNEKSISISYSGHEVSKVMHQVNSLNQVAMDLKIKEDSLEDVFKHLIGVA
ncbi:MAG: ABC transporter ATP-binding protein [Candidatus Cloacimonetes bacterium]|nr:ABC transporter ATP-binding protein [Candidatus Cloacimonadota bacterium]